MACRPMLPAAILVLTQATPVRAEHGSELTECKNTEQDKHKWSHEKQEVCCGVHEIGCDFDCQAGLRNWVNGWSDLKTKYCCRVKNLGCPVAEENDDRKCNGFMTQRGACEDLPSCEKCEPKDCIFRDWHDWVPMSGCSGLRARKRAIHRVNNECGKPCDGPREETEEVDLPKECTVGNEDCLFGDWADWSHCAEHDSQARRTRDIRQPAENAGFACEGALEETTPCPKTDPKDCVFSDWNDFTECSASCGGGWKTKTRRVIDYAENGGKPCDGNTTLGFTCNTKPCGNSQDCQFSHWSGWSSDCKDGELQRFRSRTIQSPAHGAGEPCEGDLKETELCPQISDKLKLPCTFSDWSEWSDCTATCNGGQSLRTRRLMSEPRNGGECPDKSLQEVKSCSTATCDEELDCELTGWGDWSECSATCGEGLTSRTRDVKKYSKDWGKGCNGALKEVASCEEKKCHQSDCKWGHWSPWSACTVDCGGGSKRRDRSVVVPPRGGGKLCEAEDKEEIAPCNTHQCGDCVDGEWMEWSEWTTCSATCDVGFQSRHRDVKTQPNLCGRAIDGKQDDYRRCEKDACVPDVNCTLADWSAWGGCSSSCVGVKERTREIKTMQRGNGKKCVDRSLKEVAPCGIDANGHDERCGTIPPRSCEIGDWTEWGECTSKCDGGQRARTRNIRTPAMVGGEPCQDALSEIEECNTDPCPNRACVDCDWGDWSDWGGCTKCGGQRFRHRSIIQLPNHCGRHCELADAKQTDICEKDCFHELFCGWTEWSKYGDCSAQCGPSTRMRMRSLEIRRKMIRQHDGRRLQDDDDDKWDCEGDITDWNSTWSEKRKAYCCSRNGVTCAQDFDCQAGLSNWERGWSRGKKAWCCRNHQLGCDFFFKGTLGMVCAGEQVDVSVCGTKPCGGLCTPVDGKFGEWSEWNNPSCTQLCERHRTVQVRNECGGKALSGPLTETKVCPHQCEHPEDCVLSDWTEYSECATPESQRWRNRYIKQFPANKGQACLGALFETGSCSHAQPQPVDCTYQDWEKWSECSRTCGGGYFVRSRHIDKPAAHGGKSCNGTMQELEVCKTEECPKDSISDCKMTNWGKWTDCIDGQQYKEREVLHQAAHGGKACEASELRKVRPCTQKVDCEVSDWTPWDKCDRECGGGQQHRHRQINTYPKDGGGDCPSVLQLTRGCNTQSCHKEKECKLSEWTKWSVCSTTCGAGQQERSRHMVNAGCDGPLKEIRECKESNPCGTKDCIWDDWTEWSSCTCDCGGGQRNRNRHIKQSPQRGGKPCDITDKEQVEPCNTEPCANKCIDGKWADWSHWTECSASCKGGTTWRTRRFAKEANDCGEPAQGMGHETASCNEDVTCVESQDCEFSDWTKWSGCTQECEGVQRRSRVISKHRRGDGKQCEGPLKETGPCNPSEGEDLPQKCKKDLPEDCKLSDWTAYTACSKSCDGGVQTRSRKILGEPKNGGKNCGALEVLRPCSNEPCSEDCTPQDCKWGDWHDWGACSKCGGQRKRHRHVLQHAKCGGAACTAGNAEETDACPRKCHETSYCSWGEWEEWSKCDQQCGQGSRTRTRRLGVMTDKDLLHGLALAQLDDAELESRLASLRRENQVADTQRYQQLVLSFAGGMVSLVAVLFVQRAACRRGSSGFVLQGVE
eukprot:TRINITY_DN100839_c0_g1_i1.p1 TRINITY_DN100839_c0_g1~~TRINITY_DN100839_c0_g1_i1.p1  ORF type:complete len:1646 (+),score=391.32 TRINITY_DN100839_c0_g1_i1:63-5000(+)